MLTRLYSTPWWFIWREIAFCVLGHIFQLMWSSDQKPVMYGSVEGICCLWLINCLCSLRTDYRTLRNLIFPICCKCFCMVDQDWLRMFGSSSIVWHGFVCMSCSSWLTRVTEYLVLNYLFLPFKFPRYYFITTYFRGIYVISIKHNCTNKSFKYILITIFG